MSTDLVVVTLLPPAVFLASLTLWAYLARPAAVRSGRSPVAIRGGKALAVALMLGSVLIVGVVMTNALSLFYVVGVLVLFAAVIVRWRQAEQRNLIWLLTVAAERSIPQHEAARAFAQGRTDAVGDRALRLTEYLEAGIPLGLSLQRAGIRVPPAVRLAADLGQHTGTLPTALRQADLGSSVDSALQQATHWLFYFAYIAAGCTLVLTFSLLKTTPVIERMYADFGMELPRATQALIAMAVAAAQHFYLFLPFVAVGLATLVIAVLHFVGISIRALPGTNWLWWRLDAALVLRWLAEAIRQRRSAGEMVRLLSGYFPARHMRRQLEKAGTHIDQGVPWAQSLRDVGVVGRTEARVFDAAERAGNLPWALDEMAERSLRRFSFRLRATLDLLLPFLLILIGACVLFVAIAMVMPLFNLINALT
ncbi:MAG: type II secretion system F family protein [Pirellulaceae bacterium]